MTSWFTVKVKYTKQLDNGTFKRVRELYLLAAVSFTDAEARVYEEIGSFIKGEFIVSSIQRAEFNDIFFNEGYENWFLVKVTYESSLDDEKSKKVTNKFLINGENVEQVNTNIIASLEGMLVDYKIDSIVSSKIVDVFPFSSDDKVEIQFNAEENTYSLENEEESIEEEEEELNNQ